MPAAVDTDDNSAQQALQARINALSATPVAGQDANAAEPPSAIEPPGYWTPGTAIMDVLTEFPDPIGAYRPTNYDNKEHGLVTVRTALANSLNIPAVKTLQHVGLDRFKDTMRRAGVTTLTRPDYGLSLALGGGEVTLVELTNAYATLANGGNRVRGKSDRLRAGCGGPADLARQRGRSRARLPRRKQASSNRRRDHAAAGGADLQPAARLPDHVRSCQTLARGGSMFGSARRTS